MTKQEDLREGIREIVDSVGYGFSWETAKDVKLRLNRIKTDQIINYLASKGVVLKVDRELPEYTDAKTVFERYTHAVAVEVQQDLLKAGYVATSPLMGE